MSGCDNTASTAVTIAVTDSSDVTDNSAVVADDTGIAFSQPQKKASTNVQKQ